MTYQIKLLSHAIPASPFNTEKIQFYGGKAETIVVGECEGTRELLSVERVHCRAIDEDCVSCTECGMYAMVWLSSRDRWSVHPARCGQS